MAAAERSAPGGWRRAARWISGLLTVLVIVYAILVVIGRQLLPLLDRYQPEINRYFSLQLGLSLRTTALSGEWTGLTPKFSVRGLSVANDTADATPATPALRIDRADAELDLIATLRSGTPVWQELQLGKITLTAVESADGHWSVGGRRLGAAPAGQLNQLLGTLLISKLVRVDQIVLQLDFFSGSDATLIARELLTENGAGFHRTTASLTMPSSGESARLVIEGQGDPRDLKQFQGQGYLRLDHINFSGPLRALAERWLPNTAARIGEMRTEVATELWFNTDADQGIQVQGRLRAAEVPLPATTDDESIHHLHADVRGWFHPGQSWGLRVQNLGFEWMGTAIDPLNIEISQGLGRHRDSVAVAVDHLDAGTMARMVVATGLAGANASEILRSLNPRGKLKALHLNLPLDQQQAVAIRANVERLTVDPFKDSPGARNISGYAEFVGDRGFFEIDCPQGFAMYYPQAYDDYMVYGATKGRVNVRWSAAERALGIAGGPIVIDGDEGQAQAYLYLHLPIDHSGEPEMFLLAGLRNSHSRYAPRYIPNKLNPALRHWLDRAIGDIDIPAAGFVWRGSLRGSNPGGRSLLVYGQLANGSVDYDPKWPKASGLAAEFTVEGEQFKATIHQGDLGDARVAHGEVATDHASNGNLLLDIRATIDAPLQAAVDILAASPLRSRVSALHQHWQFGGDIQANLDLAVPLSADKTGEHYRVAAQIVKGRMTLPRMGLVIDAIHGPLDANGIAALQSDNISASLWGEPLTGNIHSQAGEIRIDVAGTLPADQLLPWVPQIQRGVSGKAPYRAVLVIPPNDAPTTLAVSSTLEGVSIALPPPFEKPAAAARPVVATLEFAADAVLGNVRYGEEGAGTGLNAVTRWRDYRFDRAALSLGASPASLPDDPGLLITGHWSRLSLSDWLPWLGGDHVNGRLTELSPRFDVSFDELAIAGMSMQAIALTGDYSANGWRIHATSDVADGDISMPTEGTVAVHLNHLVLPKPELGRQGALTALDPRHLPAIDFSTRRLQVGDQDLGSLSFSARPQPAGIRFGDINANLTGLAIGDPADGDATLEWHLDDGGHRTHFSGVVHGGDLGNVLASWGLPVMLSSKEVAFITDLQWSDTPWNFSLAGLDGQVALHLRDGAFYRAPGVATNALMKLIGLVNFDTWLRRLRLDFSDLFDSGVNYDSLRGGLKFDRGQLAFDEPIVVVLPSGRMRLYGQADLQAETIDARLVATLPVATNLPWIAALAGGLPAAAGVYLSGKLFKRQVDKLSSLSYRVTGSWDDPELDIDNVFTDTDDQRRSDAKSGSNPIKE